MRKPHHNSTTFWKPTGEIKEQERIQSLEQIQKHEKLCKEIANFYFRKHQVEVTAHFEGILGWKSNAYFSLRDAEGNVKGEYQMYASEYSLWKTGQRYKLTPKGFNTITIFKKQA